MNTTLILWMYKKQPRIETSVFGADFMAMKHGMETLCGIRYKLRMMGITIEGPSYIYGDNMLVIYNIQQLEINLSKKSNSIFYHAMRETVAICELLTTHIPIGENRANFLMKSIYGRKQLYHLRNLLYGIYDNHILEHN